MMKDEGERAVSQHTVLFEGPQDVQRFLVSTCFAYLHHRLFFCLSILADQVAWLDAKLSQVCKVTYKSLSIEDCLLTCSSIASV